MRQREEVQALPRAAEVSLSVDDEKGRACPGFFHCCGGGRGLWPRFGLGCRPPVFFCEASASSCGRPGRRSSGSGCAGTARPPASHRGVRQTRGVVSPPD
ncbi:hypothetical protein BN940_16656 [Castellaniella defragrans 65Phen]|uniref:Uncharacterized protein n=1 Tax=Castellaniella defragrans (strain DSM 12143 / CCUG 39792 / 65Phen) TaxID=1437824 RepID=W8X1H0_CASD6|nr:hypothetical protein BN940_16656 [Castellaniella defragrans 65Phen]